MGQVDAQGVRGVDHAVVGGDEDGGVRRHTGDQPAHRTVDQLQLVAPLPGLAAVHVTDLVQLAPVEVDQRPVATPDGRDGRVDAGVQGGRGGEGPSAQGCVGQARPVEEARTDPGDSHPVRGRLLEHGRQRLPAPRVGAVLPGQLVEQPVLAGHQDLVADQSVGPRRQAGAERAHAGGGGRGEPGGEATGRGQQAAQERRVAAALAQQVVAQPVDQHDHRAARGRQLEQVAVSSRRVRHGEAAGDGGEHPGQPAGVVGREEAGAVRHVGAQRPIVAESSRANVMAWVSAASPSASALIRRPMSSAVTVPS